MKGRTVHGIAIDGNGNSSIPCTIEIDGPVKTSFTVREIEGLRDALMDYSCRHGGILVSQHIEREFSSLLSKIKN